MAEAAMMLPMMAQQAGDNIQQIATGITDYLIEKQEARQMEAETSAALKLKEAQLSDKANETTEEKRVEEQGVEDRIKGEEYMVRH